MFFALFLYFYVRYHEWSRSLNWLDAGEVLNELNICRFARFSKVEQEDFSYELGRVRFHSQHLRCWKLEGDGSSVILLAHYIFSDWFDTKSTCNKDVEIQYFT